MHVLCKKPEYQWPSFPTAACCLICAHGQSQLSRSPKFVIFFQISILSSSHFIIFLYKIITFLWVQRPRQLSQTYIIFSQLSYHLTICLLLYLYIKFQLCYECNAHGKFMLRECIFYNSTKVK